MNKKIPTAGKIFADDEQVNFSVAVADYEDGNIANNSINWTSSKDGFLGYGNLASLTNLSTGTHVLTVSAIDSHNVTVSKTVNIVVVGIGTNELKILSNSSNISNESFENNTENEDE